MAGNIPCRAASLTSQSMAVDAGYHARSSAGSRAPYGTCAAQARSGGASSQPMNAIAYVGSALLGKRGQAPPRGSAPQRRGGRLAARSRQALANRGEIDVRLAKFGRHHGLMQDVEASACWRRCRRRRGGLGPQRP
eukprot:344707-Prymnesium_polylepis.1